MTGSTDGTGFIGPTPPPANDVDIGDVTEESLFGPADPADIMNTPPPKADLVENMWTLAEETVDESDFKNSERFDYIVEVMKTNGYATTITESFDYEQLQDTLLHLLCNIVEKKVKLMKEENAIIHGAMGLWKTCLLSYPSLIDKFYDW